jgi:hypothetical protein
MREYEIERIVERSSKEELEMMRHEQLERIVDYDSKLCSLKVIVERLAESYANTNVVWVEESGGIGIGGGKEEKSAEGERGRKLF